MYTIQRTDLMYTIQRTDFVCVYHSFQGVFVHSDQVTWVLVAMQGEDTHSMVMENEEGCKRSGREGGRKVRLQN